MKAVLDLNEYETGIKVTRTQMEALRIRQHKTHPDWNYSHHGVSLPAGNEQAEQDRAPTVLVHQSHLEGATIHTRAG